MFKKSKRSFRQRTRQSDSDDDIIEQQNVIEDSSNITKPATNNSTTAEITGSNESSQSNDSNGIQSKTSEPFGSTKKSTKLSFHAEDEDADDTFVVKKSVYSRRMERNKKKMLRNVDSNETNGNVIKERFFDKDSTIGEPKIEQEQSDQNDMVICPGSDEDNEELDYSGKKRAGTVQFRNVLERGTIPDAKVIYELKKQRQKLARTINDEFIPLEDEEEETSKENNRLLREDEEDKSDDAEDDEDDERIQFGKVDYKTKEREKAKELFRLAQESKVENDIDSKLKQKISSDDDYSDDSHKGNQSDDSDAELDRWEREQIRKAVCLPSLYSYSEIEFQNRFLTEKSKSTVTTHKPLGEDNHNVIPIEVDDIQARFGSNIPSYISDNSTRAQKENNFEPILNRKSDYKKRLESSLEDHRQLLDRVSMDLRISKQSIEEFNSRKESFEKDAIFYNSTLDFVRNLCDCINDKLELIEKYEQMALDFLQSYSLNHREHFRKIVQDQNAMCLWFTTNHQTNLSQYQAYDGNSVFDLYDFNGDIEKRDRLVRNEERYQKLSLQQVIDGNDIEDDDASENEALYEQMQDIENKLSDIFEDATDEYASLKGVIEQFDKWRQTRLDTYSDSFVGQFIPKFVIYYIRYELVLWNLFDQTSEFDPIKLPCVEHLIRYGTLKEAKSRDVDIDIVPNVIDKGLLCRVCTLVERQLWNPLSTRQTTRLVRFLTSALSTCPPLLDSSENLPKLFKLIIQTIEDTIKKDVFIPPVIPAHFFSRANLSRTPYESLVIGYVTNFFHRQFWQAVKLIRNIVSFRHLIADQVLKELTLDRLLNDFILMSIWRCSADSDAILIQVNRLLTIIPDDWCRTSHPVLLKFSELIGQLSTDRPDDIRRKLASLKQRIVSQ